MKKIAAALCVVPLFLSLNLISVVGRSLCG